MITIDQIIELSQPHPLYGGTENGRILRLSNDKIMVSIVGGEKGLYGDFKNDFEVAVFDNSGSFITRFFFTDELDDVAAYVSGEMLLDFLNKVFKSGFQVS
jgi:hypothetical protein